MNKVTDNRKTVGGKLYLLAVLVLNDYVCADGYFLKHFLTRKPNVILNTPDVKAIFFTLQLHWFNIFNLI